MRLLFCGRNSMKASPKAINQLKPVFSNGTLTFLAPSFPCSVWLNHTVPLSKRINRFCVVNVTLIRWNWHFNLLYSLSMLVYFVSSIGKMQHKQKLNQRTQSIRLGFWWATNDRNESKKKMPQTGNITAKSHHNE